MCKCIYREYRDSIDSINISVNRNELATKRRNGIMKSYYFHKSGKLEEEF